MARPRVIDRNRLLDNAEALARHEGVASLTLGALAQAAGVSKGAVQAIFGTKDQLLDALFQRWVDEYDQQLLQLAGEQPEPMQTLAAHIAITRSIDAAEAHRAAGLMTALLGSAERRQGSNDWYRSRLALADLSTDEGRKARIAFLATEGVFLLRCFGLLQLSDKEWGEILDDVAQLMPTHSKDANP